MSDTPSQPVVAWYDDEIDLRELVLTLWHGRRIIIAATLLAALVAWVVSLLLPERYQATAVLALAPPKLQTNAITGLRLQVTMPDLKTAVALARAPEVFQHLVEDAEIQAAWAQEAQPLTWQDLAARADVQELGKDGLRLVFKDTDPQRAVLVANRWAVLVVERINTRYGWMALQSQMERQAQEAWKAYQQAQEDYEHELSVNRAEILMTQLDHVKKDLSCVLSLQSELSRLQQDVAAFGEHLSRLDMVAPLSPGDALSLVTLQQRVLANQACISEANNVQVQWSADVLSSISVAQAQDLVVEIAEALQQRLQALPEQQEALEAQIFQLQYSLEQEQRRLNELNKRRELAWDIYVSLEQLHTQGQALAFSENQVALLVAQAVVGNKVLRLSLFMVIFLSGFAGGIAGGFWVIMRAWWKK